MGGSLQRASLEHGGVSEAWPLGESRTIAFASKQHVFQQPREGKQADGIDGSPSCRGGTSHVWCRGSEGARTRTASVC